MDFQALHRTGCELRLEPGGPKTFYAQPNARFIPRRRILVEPRASQAKDERAQLIAPPVRKGRNNVAPAGAVGRVRVEHQASGAADALPSLKYSIYWETTPTLHAEIDSIISGVACPTGPCNLKFQISNAVSGCSRTFSAQHPA